MSRFKYRVQYDKNPPRADRVPLTDAQVTAVLSNFRNDLSGCLVEDLSATVSSEPYRKDRNAILVVIVTTLNVAKTDAAVQMCAKSHDLNTIRLLGA
jgi:hypothetical protein